MPVQEPFDPGYSAGQENLVSFSPIGNVNGNRAVGLTSPQRMSANACPYSWPGIPRIQHTHTAVNINGCAAAMYAIDSLSARLPGMKEETNADRFAAQGVRSAPGLTVTPMLVDNHM